MRDFFRSLYTSMQPCIVRILHSADYFNFWILLRTIQGITVLVLLLPHFLPHKLFYGCDITFTIPILRKTFYFLEHCGLWLLLSVPLPPFANSLSHRTKFVRFASSWCSTISWWEENNFNWQIIYSVSVVGFSEYILHTTYIITTGLGWNYNFFEEEIYK